MGGKFTWRVFFAAILSRLMGGNSRAFAAPALISGVSRPATITSQTLNRAGLLTSERELLAHESRQARRHHHRVKHLHRRAYSITCDILARGVR